jgi:WXXGXW repeat (2 copies)
MRKLCFIVLALFVVLALPTIASAQIAVGVSIRIGPPALPVYEQPLCPGPGYMWTPGYWAYGPDGYYWVPGTWVMAPTVGLLWTPGYWGWRGGFYYWHTGYWGPHIGFYGGIHYGFGYTGVGFVGGYWHGGVFAYNTAVMHVNTTVIHNTYVNNTVINNVTVNNHVSYNGGTGGTTAQPTAAERAAENEHHIPATEAQRQHEHMASTNRAMLASENQGRPAVAATAHPGEFSGHGVVAAKASGGTYHSFTPPSHNAQVHGTTANTRPFTPPSHNQTTVQSTKQPVHSNTSTTVHSNNQPNKQVQAHPHQNSQGGGKPNNPPPRDQKPGHPY